MGTLLLQLLDSEDNDLSIVCPKVVSHLNGKKASSNVCPSHPTILAILVGNSSFTFLIVPVNVQSLDLIGTFPV